MESVLLGVRIFLFGIFALAAIGKLLDREGSLAAVKEFGVPESPAELFAAVLPYLELAIAFLLLFTATSWIASIAAFILMVVFIGGMAYQMAKGNAPDCHCFGQIHSKPVSAVSIGRNAAFALLAAVLAVNGASRQGPSLGATGAETFSTAATLTAGVIALAGLLLLKQLLDGQKKIERRLDIMELISREGVPLERQDAGHPQDGLPIGSPFPDFAIPDLNGKTTAFEQILARNRPMLFFFVSPTCEPCKALIPDIEKWQAEMSGKAELILLTSGTAAENREKFPSVLADSILIQTNREVAEKVRARWTPTALFVRSDGTIASHLAAGDSSIRQLVSQVMEADLSAEAIFFAGPSKTSSPLKIGNTVPPFELTDISGREVTDEDLRGTKTLAVFWSLTCPHCVSMMDGLKQWDASKNGHDPRLVVFSSGSEEEHEEFELNSPIVLDKDHKVSQLLGMSGTPSAVLIDEKGKIISETAVGSANIWALIGREI